MKRKKNNGLDYLSEWRGVLDAYRGYFLEGLVLMIEERFWEKVKVVDNDKCWEWLASRTLKGYGHFKIKGRTVRAHRYSYTLVKGPIPKDLWVLHKCDNPSCVNPNHLFLGTHGDNMKDMFDKGRDKRKPIVDSNGVAYKSVCEASRILGLDQSSISKVLLGKRKRHGKLNFRYL